MAEVLCVFFVIFFILSLTILCVVVHKWMKYKETNESNICRNCVHYKNVNIVLDGLAGDLRRCNLADESGESRMFVYGCDKCENFQQKPNL